jgi:hypothetical protein
MKRVYAPQEERKAQLAQPERDPPQQEAELDRLSSEPLSAVALSQLPSAPEARSLRQTAVRQMQQTHGNAHVQRELFSEVNRQEEEEEVPVEAQAPTPATQAPTADTGAPAPAVQAPPTETQAPRAETGAPGPTAEAEASTAETGAPAPEAEAPTAETGAPAGEAPGMEGAQAPATISGDGSTVSADAGGVTIDGTRLNVNAGMVNINSAMVTTSGVLRANTLVADSVISSTYTPGVGNLQ